MSRAMRRLLPALLLSLAPVALAGGAQPPLAAVSTAQVTNDPDVLIMEVLSMSNLAEIQTSQLALQKSQDQSVRAFATMMIRMHSDAQRDLLALAARRNVRVTSKPGADQRLQYDKLATLSGAAFDAEYKKVQVSGHEMTLNLIRTYRSIGKDAAVQAFAAKAEPMVAAHLDQARRLP